MNEKIRIFSPMLDIVLFVLFVLFFPFAVILSLYYPNVILEQGLSHRIFYFHVSVAWVALYAPALSALFGLIYIVRKNPDWDTLSYSLNKLSLLFSILVLISGPIWAYSAWGTPWDWTDARLQSFFILVVSLLSYFVFRSLITDRNKKYLYSSFLSLLCALNALLTWGAIRWIENPGNHPGSVLGRGGMDKDMKETFWVNVLAYHILFLILFLIIYRKEKLDSKLEQVRGEME
ncbi:MAG TPA: cytochrome c biogenesis protein CcsA [Leptospiraceae bacterium]|nr:cytochrome c biogenesis protein CcsA [Leptospiraceae bacterium]HMW07488.1 cytochrome c biogenesis protein CcsA [Leptospiraceae bacterium]HMX33102.1 cytochrome c biogenesis protein CcsA [Leptospiraceae bacterium]HMY33118.1 cytochrome c biogenesis protein CcsA [Leptospiraceae bacterium]HMZ64243.1 cytochrome c biogenesis protein CcsA [Leptospiraceae bacterium]